MTPRGRFITFEGVEGEGKSTQLAAAARFLAARGLACEVTREPGGTPVAEALRRLLLEPQAEPLDATAELLLGKNMAAAIPAILATWLSFGIYAAGAALIVSSTTVLKALFDPMWRTRGPNSGNSSRNKTPRYASYISPDLGIFPPPTKPACEIV